MKQFLITVGLLILVFAVAGWELEEKTYYSKDEGEFLTSSYVRVFNRWNLSPYRVEKIDRTEYVTSQIRAGKMGSNMGTQEILEVRNGKIVKKGYGEKNPHESLVDNAITNPN